MVAISSDDPYAGRENTHFDCSNCGAPCAAIVEVLEGENRNAGQWAVEVSINSRCSCDATDADIRRDAIARAWEQTQR